METDACALGQTSNGALGLAPQRCGLLARTIVESPIVHWALPAQLRSPTRCDVVFVGEHFIQICEVRRVAKCGKATQLHVVARHSGFGSKIRNAGVLGLGSEPGDPDRMRINGAVGESIPPQILVLSLECGDFVFIFVRSDGTIAESRFPPPRPTHINQGFHLAIDPSSRFMATGTPEGIVIIYKMEPISELGRQFSTNGRIQPIKAFKARSVQGAVLRMEFLFPDPQQPDQVILLFVVARAGATEVIAYKWHVDDDLDQVLTQEKRGHRLPDQHRMPLLVIPLMQLSAFLLVFEESTLICKNVLGDALNVETVNIGSLDPTQHHHGLGPPLWTCWARGYRNKNYHALKDDLYLAREDGAIIHIALQPDLFQKTFLGDASCSISTAFTVILDPSFDFLFVGGDSSPGSVLEVEPRKPLHQLAAIPNWTPAVDIVTTNVTRTGTKLSTRAKPQGNGIFAATGRGASASITEYRYGIQADIVLDMDFEEPIKNCWVFKGNFGSGMADATDLPYYHLLLSLPDSSAFLSLPHNLLYVTPDPGREMGFDNGRTLDARQIHGELIVQVTEHSTVLISPSKSVHHTHQSVFGIEEGAVYFANCWDNYVAVIHQITQDRHEICLAKVDGLSLTPTQRLASDSVITCASSCRIAGYQCLLTGQRYAGTSLLTVYEVQADSLIEKESIRLDMDEPYDVASSPTAIAVASETAESALIAIGTQNGYLLTLELSREARVVSRQYTERLAPIAIQVMPMSCCDLIGSAVLACAGSELLLLSKIDEGGMPRFKSKQRIFPIDDNAKASPAPPIHYALCFGDNLRGRPGYISVLMVSQGRIMLADMSPELNMVPRHLRLGGTPTKLMYSKTLRCLVVAILKDNRPTICFIDPDKGTDMSYPVSRRDGEPLEYAHGLGGPDDRIYGLEEWLYVKNGKTFPYIAITTKSGQLLVVSAIAKEQHVHYWTRFRLRVNSSPMYAIACHPTGIVVSSGSTIHGYILEEAEKRFMPVYSYTLDSSVISLSVTNDVVRALTMNHSFVTIEPRMQQGNDTAFTVQSDEASRKSMHMIEMDISAEGPPSLTLTSDRYCGIRGLARNNEQQTSCELKVYFAGELGSSVRKFCRGHVRPYWSSLNQSPKFGRIPTMASGEDNDVFGVSLDGSLRHFTLLSIDLWLLLDLVQTRAKMDEFSSIFDSSYQPPRRLYQVPETEQPGSIKPLTVIDGDLLKRVLDKRGLEFIMDDSEAMASFRSFLNGLDGGIWAASFDNDNGEDHDNTPRYFALCYQVLEYLLDAVI